MLVKNINQVGTTITVGDVTIRVLEITNRTVRLGIDAPRDMQIDTFLPSEPRYPAAPMTRRILPSDG